MTLRGEIICYYIIKNINVRPKIRSQSEKFRKPITDNAIYCNIRLCSGILCNIICYLILCIVILNKFDMCTWTY